MKHNGIEHLDPVDQPDAGIRPKDARLLHAALKAWIMKSDSENGRTSYSGHWVEAKKKQAAFRGGKS